MNVTISGAIQIHDSESEWDNDARARGLATIAVNRLPMHLEAIEVAGGDPDGTGWADMKAANSEYQEQLDFVYLVGSADSPLWTIQIDGRDYILIATPFC